MPLASVDACTLRAVPKEYHRKYRFVYRNFQVVVQSRSLARSKCLWISLSFSILLLYALDRSSWPILYEFHLWICLLVFTFSFCIYVTFCVWIFHSVQKPLRLGGLRALNLLGWWLCPIIAARTTADREWEKRIRTSTARSECRRARQSIAVQNRWAKMWCCNMYPFDGTVMSMAMKSSNLNSSPASLANFSTCVCVRSVWKISQQQLPSRGP